LQRCCRRRRRRRRRRRMGRIIKMTLDIEGEDSQTVNGTYTYSKPKVILEDNEGAEVEGTVDGNKLRLDFTEYLGNKITFIFG
jgi:hypothetical protein